MEDLKWDTDDIVIMPAESSDVNSRSECIPYIDFNGRKVLPLIASPMDTVVSTKNYQKYIDAGIIPCLPRGLSKENLYGTKAYFQSYGLCEIEMQLKGFKATNKDIPMKDTWRSAYNPVGAFWHYPNVLIDIANGHMSKLIPLIQDIKNLWPDMTLMVGNVANPETFVNLGMAGVDYVRCSVGTGAGCTTAANVSVNYPMGSLISECALYKKQYALKTKIVADGGMRNYSDIIKCLCIGADYVMCGSLFNKAIESAGFNYLYGIKMNDKLAELLWRYGFSIKKKYRGMSTKAVQRSWGKTHLVTAEGITKYQKVEYTLDQWTENFKDYLKSAMSYCNAKTLEDFIGKAEYVFITQNALKRFQK
jgi:IMP dehydrogenase/GMP reductase